MPGDVVDEPDARGGSSRPIAQCNWDHYNHDHNQRHDPDDGHGCDQPATGAAATTTSTIASATSAMAVAATTRHDTGHRCHDHHRSSHHDHHCY